MNEQQILFRYRAAMLVFMVGLVVSGLTAFPLLREVEALTRWLGIAPGADTHALAGWRWWLAFVRQGLRDTYAAYPFMAYGTDWLAFAHLVIAVYFIGPLVRPRGGRWILISG